MENVIVIPARLDSSRLPNKVLLDLGGKSVLRRVYEICAQIPKVKVFIATDSKKVINHCESFAENLILTGSQHQSGTERICEASSKIDCENIINVQADEPLINPKTIIDLLDIIKNPDVDMASVYERIQLSGNINNPNIVKVVKDLDDYAMYFSRAKIPYDRDKLESDIFIDKHVGIYAYKKNIIKNFPKLKPSKYEEIEKLEQLRFLENGIKIKLIKSKYSTKGIDTFEDYNEIKKLFS